MKTHSRIGFILSIVAHSLVLGGIWAVVANSTPKWQEKQDISSISMEMLAARLEQPQVAVAAEAQPQPEAVQEPEPEKVVEPQPQPEPTLPKPQPLKPKPIEKLKESVKPKPKKEPVKERAVSTDKKVKAEKVVKALEKGKESKQGIVAKAIPNATVGTKVQAGVANQVVSGQATAGNVTTAPNSNDINAYKTQLQRALQQRANSVYPQREKMMRKGGIVTISFHFSSTGEISQVSVVNSAGNTNLDNAAVRAAQSTRMNTSPPVGFPRSFSVPIKFSVQ